MVESLGPRHLFRVLDFEFRVYRLQGLVFRNSGWVDTREVYSRHTFSAISNPRLPRRILAGVLSTLLRGA